MLSRLADRMEDDVVRQSLIILGCAVIAGTVLGTGRRARGDAADLSARQTVERAAADARSPRWRLFFPEVVPHMSVEGRGRAIRAHRRDVLDITTSQKLLFVFAKPSPNLSQVVHFQIHEQCRGGQ